MRTQGDEGSATRPYEVVKFVKGRYWVTRRCVQCGETTSVTVGSQDLWDYEHQTFAQRAFTYLTPDEREAVFISGTCASCWDRMFADDDD